jgi:hypothetical protein
MEWQHVNVKLLVREPEQVKLEVVIPVFHRWIQEQEQGELLLDVADYRHVPAGPGVVLIGHDGNYSLDNTGGRLGVRYNRKTPLAGTNQDRLAQAAEAALAACVRLEREPSLDGTIRFDGREIEVWINDHLLAPNSAETRRAAHADLQDFFAHRLGGGEFDLAYPEDPRCLFGVRATFSAPVDAVAWLENLRALAPATGSR